ncbi:ankyrin repeat-containing domain protein [Diplogelasinospora grovesii]|uniref:protein S-acyltransferase n=1 Tax=Diplogelasinospora grovesii TaxID=303347 RepID=A0AAN6S688_9PEZI|nr:ankyrin repeat-containing domain protein [Diplogelasinospora grovesii]
MAEFEHSHGTKRKRLNFQKCAYCRKNKKKCEPTDRQWPAEKCNRCERIGLPCSETLLAHEDQGAATKPNPAQTSPSVSAPDVKYPGLQERTEDILIRARWATQRQRVLNAMTSQPSSYCSGFQATFTKVITAFEDGLAAERVGLLSEAMELVRTCPDDNHDIQSDFLPRIVDGLAWTAVCKSSISNNFLCEAVFAAPASVLGSLLSAGSIHTALLLQESLLCRLVQQSNDQASPPTNPEVLREGLAAYHNISAQLRDRAENRGPGPHASHLPLFEGNGLLPLAICQFSDFRAKDCFQRTLLHVALYNDVEDGLERIIDGTAAERMLDERDCFGHTPLHVAVIRGYKPVIQKLLEAGANPRLPDDLAFVPLHHAAAAGRVSSANLLANPRTVNKQDIYGRTPLMMASKNGRHRVVRLLLSCGGADPNSRDAIEGSTALHYAATLGLLNVVKELLDSQSVSPSLKDGNGRTPLWHAAAGGHEDVAVCLVVKDGAEGQSQAADKDGITPLAIASRNGHSSIVDMLQAGSFLDGPIMMMLFSTGH